MISRLPGAKEAANAEQSIAGIIAAHAEWLCVERAGNVSHALRRNEIELRVAHHRLIFSCWTSHGVRSWRITGWEWNGEKLLLEATRRAGAEHTMLELIPRALASAIAATISDARRRRCEELARLACALSIRTTVERMALSAGARRGQPGRYARILLLRGGRERIALSGPVAAAEPGDVDALLASTLIWYTRASERVRQSGIQQLWLAVPAQCLTPLRQRIGLLRESLRRAITIYQIDDEWQNLQAVPDAEDTPHSQPKPLRRPPRIGAGEAAAEIISLAPDCIDVVRARHGETLRFHGLAFARVRKVLNRERVWFGIEGAGHRPLDEQSFEEWSSLIADLEKHRRATPEDPRHALYRAAPEAWLESILRRDITRLDPGLIIAPLHAQFRTSASASAGVRPIDLLALRQDGRLAVIELKVSEDREHVLQGADYWRQVEAHRLAGNIAEARLFGDATIADEPPLVYLAAPVFRFHRAFETLARAVRPEIEMYRFDLNEDWRAGVRVMRRTRIGEREIPRSATRIDAITR